MNEVFEANNETIFNFNTTEKAILLSGLSLEKERLVKMRETLDVGCFAREELEKRLVIVSELAERIDALTFAQLIKKLKDVSIK